MKRTSMTDNGKYPQFCYLASWNDEAFENFKREPEYHFVLEHTTPDQGVEYLKIISANSSLKLNPDLWQTILQNDQLGNPYVATYEFENASLTCSPTTLRYIKVASDIFELFDTAKIESVSEIGIGYAGQARILTKLLLIKNYTLIDLPEVLALSEKFLERLNENLDRFKFVDGKHYYLKDEFDFCISNYAFSELTRAVQDSYLEKVILKSRAGYITWNCLSNRDLDGYSIEELLKIIPNSKTIDERPLTYPGNRIIIWGEK